MNLYLLRPKSRGAVSLRSKRPRDLPVIDPNYMSHPYDVETMIEGKSICVILCWYYDCLWDYFFRVFFIRYVVFTAFGIIRSVKFLVCKEYL